MFLACAQLPAVVASTNVRVGAASQLSCTVGLENVGVAVHSIVWSVPTPEITGAMASLTGTVLEHVLVHPEPSTMVSVSVNELLQALVVCTLTHCAFEAPTIVAAPLT